MSYRIRTQTKIAPPDEAQLLSGMERLGLLLQQHVRQVAIIFAVILVAAAIVAVVLWLDRQNAERALELEHQATKLYLDRPVEKPQQADQNLKQAIALYRQLLDQYPRTPSARLALFHLGNALVQANDLSGAIEAYQKYVSAYRDNPMLLGLVLQRLAYAQLLKGDTDAARKTFTLTLEMAGTLNKDQVLFELGKIEESQSRPEGALAYYQELTKAYPNSPFAGEATVRAKALEAKKGPAESAPPTSAPSINPPTEQKK